MSEEYDQWYWKLYRWVRWELPNQHKYIKYGVKNLYKWFWIIWKDRDWDYYYIFQVLKFKLEKQANRLGGRDAELMMTCVRLINKLQNEEYYQEYYDSKPMDNEMMHRCQAQHDKAKRLLFHIMSERINYWWD